jgi:hypothetical protein
MQPGASHPFDRLDVDVSESVAIAFTDEVIRNLPADEFELSSSLVDAWVANHPEACDDRGD